MASIYRILPTNSAHSNSFFIVFPFDFSLLSDFLEIPLATFHDDYVGNSDHKTDFTQQLIEWIYRFHMINTTIYYFCDSLSGKLYVLYMLLSPLYASNLNTLAGVSFLANFFKKGLLHSCCPVNFAKFLRTPIL